MPGSRTDPIYQRQLEFLRSLAEVGEAGIAKPPEGYGAAGQRLRFSGLARRTTAGWWFITQEGRDYLAKLEGEHGS